MGICFKGETEKKAGRVKTPSGGLGLEIWCLCSRPESGLVWFGISDAIFHICRSFSLIILIAPYKIVQHFYPKTCTITIYVQAELFGKYMQKGQATSLFKHTCICLAYPAYVVRMISVYVTFRSHTLNMSKKIGCPLRIIQHTPTYVMVF